MLKQGELSASVQRLSRRIAEIRLDAITLLQQEPPLPSHQQVEEFMTRVQLPRLQNGARKLLDSASPREALVYLRRHLSNLRRRAGRVMCMPVVTQQSVSDFVEHFGEGDSHSIPISRRHDRLWEIEDETA